MLTEMGDSHSEASLKVRAFHDQWLPTLILNHNGLVVHVSDSAAELFGYDPEEMKGKIAAELLFTLAHRPVLRHRLSVCLMFGVKRGSPSDRHLSAVTKEGRLLTVNVRFSVLRHQGELYAMCQMQDITEQLRREQELIDRATRDHLTGLYNRQYFFEEGAREFARAQRHGTDASLLMIDLDHFKKINDAHGHPAGDKVLRRFADVLKDRSRASDIFSRVGGEEFAALLVSASEGGARAYANALLKVVREQTVDVGADNPVGFTVSVGVSVLNERIGTFQDWYNEADAALYEAKRKGRNCVVVHGRAATRKKKPARSRSGKGGSAADKHDNNTVAMSTAGTEKK